MLIVLFFQQIDCRWCYLHARGGSRLNLETEERGTTEVVENRS